MFIIKLIMSDGSFSCMHCKHYGVSKLNEDCIELTLYPQYTQKDGVSYRISKLKSQCNIPHFDRAFVMNESGKTIDKVE